MPGPISPQDQGDSRAPDGARIRLLVVDDEAMMRRVFELAIPAHRYAMTFCQDASSALAAFKAQPFDIVLTDCKMPEMPGELLAREIYAQSVATPIILMSGREIAPPDIPSVVGFLKKPFKAAQLFAALGDALNRPDRLA